MDRTDSYIESTDCSQQLHYCVWESEGRPVGVLQLVHGMEEYIERYEPLAKAMTERGWAVIGHDHLGHGKSGRWERGFFTECPNGADVLIADMNVITQVAKCRWPGVPVFIYGHSMGSFFTRRYLAEYGKEVKGAIICGSGWYNTFLTGSAYWASRIIGAFCGMHQKSALLTAICSSPFANAFKEEGKGAWLSKNKDNVARYKADPLCGFGFTCGGYRDMYHNLMRVSDGYHDERLVPMPLLIISGSDDPVGGSQGVKRIARYYQSLGFDEVTQKLLAGDRHEILFEDDGPSTIAYIAQWLERHNL